MAGGVSYLRLLRRALLSPRRATGMARHMARRRLSRPDVLDLPSFDADGLAMYAESLERAGLLLEYGAGGSTIFAASNNVSVISVENDKRYVRHVGLALRESGLADLVNILYCDVGMTLDWGIPLDKEPTRRNLARWKQYVTAPWAYVEQRGMRPHAVLVDGRFRVACVAYSTIEVKRRGIDIPILLDDYAQRPHYSSILEICDIRRRAGRMVQLCPKHDVDVAAAEGLLSSYLADWR